MPSSPRQRRLLTADLSLVTTDDGSGTLWNHQLQETYHSESGAAAESRRVFLELSGVAEALAAGRSPAVLEIGLGTGLNFALTSARAEEFAARLNYCSLELFPLPLEVLRQWASAMSPILPPWWSLFLQEHESARVSPDSEWEFSPSPHVQFRGCFFDARRRLPAASFDIIYHDAFSPAAAPDMWTADFFRRLAEVLKPGGILTTYCVKRTVRDALTSAGFIVEKHAGPPGGKREILRAILPHRLSD